MISQVPHEGGGLCPLESALIVFLVLGVAGVAAMTLDYTDTYVATRFHKALASERYEIGSPFSLDSFLEYYDFDDVCVGDL